MAASMVHTERGLDAEDFPYMTHHVFLPPQLPDADDTDPLREMALMRSVHSALQRFMSLQKDDDLAGIMCCIKMVNLMMSLRDSAGALDSDTLDEALSQLQENDTMTVMVKSQNAAMIVTHHGSEVQFESFELLARDEDVIKCEGRLRRWFPGPLVATITNHHIGDPTFREPFTEALAKMDHERAPHPSLDSGHGAGYRSSYCVSENIKSIHPRLITEMIMGILRGVGHGSSGPGHNRTPFKICKHTREEVMGPTEAPWRRSPLWLLVRVSLHLISERAAQQASMARGWYKDFMVFFFAQVLRDAADMDQPHDILFIMMAKVSCRILKLKPTRAPWLSAVERILVNVQSKLERGWAKIQTSKGNTLDFSPLRSLPFATDINLSLTTLRPYLRKVTTRPPLTETAPIEQAKDHNPRTFCRDRFPDGQFTRNDGSLLLYELADFENWVESHLGLGSFGYVGVGVPKPEMKKQPPSDEEEYYNTSENGSSDGESDGGAEICFADETDRPSNSLTPPEPTWSGTASFDIQKSDSWSRVGDNSFASSFLTRADSGRAHSLERGADPPLCERCRNIRPLDPGFRLYINFFKMEKSARSCQLCQMIRRSLAVAHLTGSVQDVVLYRDGTNLKSDGRERPILRICAEQESPNHKDIQVGRPALPGAGSDAHFDLLNEWLQSCDCGPLYSTPDDGGAGGCGGEKTNALRLPLEPLPGRSPEPSFRPTRVLDVGGPDPAKLRLHCATESPGPHDYVALSHCWGTPDEEEWRRVCTRAENLDARSRGFAFDDLPRTFQDAVTVTRRLGKRFVWIDSLCIVQGDTDDWERESQLMESIFSSAYCTISATSAKGFNDGFLRPRQTREWVLIRNAPKDAGTLWLCETVDDFRADVEEGPVNHRGWVFQERVLSRRVIYFTNNQTYYECGGGVRCETMTRLRNPKAAILGDSQFPAMMRRYSRADQVSMLQKLFETYSGLNLTVPTDKPVAIAGLERRLEKGGFGPAPYGLFDDHHRGLLWQRRGDSLQRIKYPPKRAVPSWSWMAYHGPIQYMNVPTQGVEWLGRLVTISKPCKDHHGSRNTALQVVVNKLSHKELDNESWRLRLDDPGSLDTQDLMCVMVGRHADKERDSTEYYAILVIPRFQGGYQRVGIGSLERRHVRHGRSRLEGYLV